MVLRAIGSWLSWTMPHLPIPDRTTFGYRGMTGPARDVGYRRVQGPRSAPRGKGVTITVLARIAVAASRIDDRGANTPALRVSD
ncbi:hypothetical protein [Asaia krungthepensis]|uniref:hypothetical protein n=1 Tax=Asaia krungthepensis TaxID=220990 RepID=UPI00222F016C|nr:hypothetical protein [Asaia krungthepensis]